MIKVRMMNSFSQKENSRVSQQKFVGIPSPISQSSKSITPSRLSNQSVNESLPLASSMNATPSNSADSRFIHPKTVEESVLDQSEVSVQNLLR